MELGNDVTILDNFSAVCDKFNGIRKHPNLKIVHGDVQNAGTVTAQVKKVDYVFHLAVEALLASLVNPRIVHDVNVTGTLNVCLACKKHPPRRLVHVSSSEVYGTAQYVPMDENHPFCPTTPYGASKAASEVYVRSFYNTWNIPAVVVRPFNTYGPQCKTGQYSAVIIKFFNRLIDGKPPVIYGDGKQTRDFTFVSDTVDGIIKAAECDALLGDAVNIARGEEVSIMKLAEVMINLMGMRGNADPIFRKERLGDVRRHFADISKARRLLNFKPKVSIEEGLKKFIDWEKDSRK